MVMDQELLEKLVLGEAVGVDGMSVIYYFGIICDLGKILNLYNVLERKVACMMRIMRRFHFLLFFLFQSVNDL